LQTRGPVEIIDTDARTIHGLGAFDPSKWTLPPMISSDTHVMEPLDLWDQLPERLKKNIPVLNFGGARPAGSGDPVARVVDQDTDGVGADIIFPNYGMGLFGIDDPETQFEAMRVYNDFIADFCKTSPKRLFGVPAISVYDIDKAIAEMHRAHAMGLIGIMVWQVPDPKLPFSSDHYEKLWAAAAEAGAPVHTHILTGHSYTKNPGWSTMKVVERIRNSVNQKQHDTVNALYDLIFYGVFERHPKLKLVLAESEMGWLPYLLQQWDYYYERFAKEEMPIKRLPSETFMEHVYATFLEDFAGTRHLNWWGQNNVMWSNDYPHFNMTFPNSRANVVRHIGNLTHEQQVKLVRGNALDLYKLAL
jgi:uncharacterized protein